MSIQTLRLPLVLCVGLWNAVCSAQNLTPIRELEASRSPITQVAFAPRGDTVSVTFKAPRMGWLSRFSRVSNGEVLSERPGLSEVTRTVVFAPNGDRFAWAIGPRLISSPQSRKPGEEGGTVINFPTLTAAFSPDGTVLAAVSDSIKNRQVHIRLFDSKTGKVKGDLKATPPTFSHDEDITPISSITFSPDGKQLIGANLASISTWDVNTQKLSGQKLHLQAEQITLSPDGTSAGIVFSEPIGPSDGSEMHSRQLWLQTEGKEFDLTLKPGLGDQFEFSGAPTFSLDGRFIAAPVWRGGQNSISIWNTNDGKEVLRYPTQFEQKSLIFGPKNKQGIALASVYENSIDKSQHAILWRLTLPL